MNDTVPATELLALMDAHNELFANAEWIESDADSSTWRIPQAAFKGYVAAMWRAHDAVFGKWEQKFPPRQIGLWESLTLDEIED